MKIEHVPVLIKEAIDYLALKDGMTILDCTVGTGGHAEAILKRIGCSGCLIGIDRDGDVLKNAGSRLGAVSENFKLFHSNYDDLDSILNAAGIGGIDGAIMDLGVSSFQMDTAERGFSIKNDGPLDMRMDKRGALRASDIINRYPKAELISIFRKYGDEYFAERISEKIIRERKKENIATTGRLADIIKQALPYRYRFRRIHPATKVFMALRIAVNREIESMESGISKAVVALKKGSRLCVISFHSVEDRVVKSRFKEMLKAGTVKVLTKKPLRPSEAETKNNPRSRSAKLRVMEKI